MTQLKDKDPQKHSIGRWVCNNIFELSDAKAKKLLKEQPERFEFVSCNTHSCMSWEQPKKGTMHELQRQKDKESAQ